MATIKYRDHVWTGDVVEFYGMELKIDNVVVYKFRRNRNDVVIAVEGKCRKARAEKESRQSNYKGDRPS